MYTPKGVHTIAALRESEDYTTLKEGFSPVIDEINQSTRKNLVRMQGDIRFELRYFIIIINNSTVVKRKRHRLTDKE